MHSVNYKSMFEITNRETQHSVYRIMKRINQLQNPFELSNLILENARAGVANQM